MRRLECLNGEWDFTPVYDDYEPADTIKAILPEEEKIRVPSSWRYLLTFMPTEKQNHRPYNMFDYPEIWNEARTGVIGRKLVIKREEKERVWLVFNGVLQRSKIYINDKLINESHEAFLPFKIDITDLINGKEDVLDLKVWCGSFKTIDTENGTKRITPDGTWFADMSRGIWQDAFLEYTPEVCINDYQIITSFREKQIAINTAVISKETKEHKVYLNAYIYDGSVLIKELKSSQIYLPSDGVVTIPLIDSWTEPEYWSPENPYLYSMKLELAIDGEVVDTINTRFGFREVWFEKHKFFINGVRINLRGDSWHYQGFAQQTKEYALNWYKICKDTGINFIRLHAMPYPELYLEAADEVGMLIIDESAIYGSWKSIMADDTRYIENCYKHLEALVKRDRNHPCVIMWSMQNEMRWVDGRDTYKGHIKELMSAINKLDGTRLISCDGDNRLLDREDMQVLSMHYNIDGTVNDWDRSLPLVFGEHGKWHYISPQVSSSFVGQSAYLSFEEALRGLGLEEKMFLEYIRKEEVTGITPFNMCNYMMKTMPDEDIRPEWVNITTPGVKPKVVVNNSLTMNNGLLKDEELCRFNRSYYACRDGYAQVIIVPDEYNDSFFGDIEIIRSFNIYNDTLSKKNSKIIFYITQEDGSIVKHGEENFAHLPGERYNFTMDFKTPDVSCRENIKIDMVLYQNGVEKYKLSRKYKIYPTSLKKEFIKNSKGKIAYIGCNETLSVLEGIVKDIKVIGEISEEKLEDRKVLVIGKNFNASSRTVQPILDAYSKKGGVIIILEQKSFTVGDASLSGRRFFKAFINVKGHKIFDGLWDEDIGLWDNRNIFNSTCEYLVSNSFNKPLKGDFKILLECGEGDFGWGGLLWTPMLEYNNGIGKVILSQLELTKSFNEVPQACIIFRNMLEYAFVHRPEQKPINTSLITTGASEFGAFFKEIGLESVNAENEDVLLGSELTLIEPCLLEGLDMEKLKKYMEDGGTLVLPAVEPEQAERISSLTGKKVKISRDEVYQLGGTGNALLDGISAFDIYKFEKVSYSPATKQNIVLCEYSVELDESEILLENVKNPWKEFFVDGLDSEPIKMGIATMYESSDFIKKSYGLLLNCGKGRLVISQVKLVNDEKFIRFYTRLLGNLGACIKTDILEYVKENTDYAISAFMGLMYDEKVDFIKMENYFTDRKYTLNNLGEGVYGWMTRFEETGGYINIPGSSNKTYFLTVFIESEINRNPLKREDGQLPDSSIVPDLLVNSNCSFKLWVDGICYKDFRNTSGDMQKIKIDDVLLDMGVNSMLFICYGNSSDIKINACFANKYGDFADGLKYPLTLD